MLSSTFLLAGGYRVSLQGVRQAAMAHTSAHTRDASVLFFNPAGMSFIPEKLSVVAGGFGIKTKAEYQNASTWYHAETDNKMGTPLYLAASYKVYKDLSAGLSVTTPYGNSVNWGKDWDGRDLVQDIELRSFFIQPTVSYKINKWISAGAGLIYATGNIELNRAISGVSNDASLQLDSKASGLGYNLGVYVKPTKELDVSVAYRSNVDMKTQNGKANFTIPSSLIGSSKFPVANDGFSATLPLASELTFGLSYKVTPKWTIATDINFAGWSKYESLDIDFEKATLGDNPNDLTISSTKKEFKNSRIYRIGSEYLINDKFAGRLGYYYDESPVQDMYWSPETPSTSNHALTGGVGYTVNKNILIDATAGYILGKVRDINNTDAAFYGQVRSKAVFFGLGLTYNK